VCDGNEKEEGPHVAALLFCLSREMKRGKAGRLRQTAKELLNMTCQEKQKQHVQGKKQERRVAADVAKTFSERRV
jgi:hypothetical protein